VEVFKGRPSDCAGRTSVEILAYDLLDGLGIEYTRTDHEPAENMEICRGINEVLDVHICKNLFLCNRQQTVFYLLLMPGDKPFKTKDLSGQLGVSRLSFAGEEQMLNLLGVKPGSVSVLGLMNDKEVRVRLLIDEDVLGEECFGCHPCRNTSSIRFKTDDLLCKILPVLKHEFTKVKL